MPENARNQYMGDSRQIYCHQCHQTKTQLCQVKIQTAMEIFKFFFWKKKLKFEIHIHFDVNGPPWKFRNRNPVFTFVRAGWVGARYHLGSTLAIKHQVIPVGCRTRNFHVDRWFVYVCMSMVCVCVWCFFVHRLLVFGSILEMCHPKVMGLLAPPQSYPPQEIRPY